MLSTKTHGFIDYGVGLFLSASPWLLGFSGHTTATIVALAFGAGIMLLGVLTNYRLGRWREVPVAAHLVLEALAGVGLVSAPLVLDLADDAWVPLIGIGFVMLLLAAVTRRRPGSGIQPLLDDQSPASSNHAPHR